LINYSVVKVATYCLSVIEALLTIFYFLHAKIGNIFGWKKEPTSVDWTKTENPVNFVVYNIHVYPVMKHVLWMSR
jgi:hypothetical protein